VVGEQRCLEKLNGLRRVLLVVLVGVMMAVAAHSICNSVLNSYECCTTFTQNPAGPPSTGCTGNCTLSARNAMCTLKKSATCLSYDTCTTRSVHVGPGHCLNYVCVPDSPVVMIVNFCCG
jgi:hypothetical protein